MYPERELSRLAAHKTVLRRRILLRRVQCVEAAAGVAQPFAWLDRLRAIWRQLLPVARVAAAPLGVLLLRAVFFRVRKIPNLLVRWGPLAFGLLRFLGAAVKGRHRTTRPDREMAPRRR